MFGQLSKERPWGREGGLAAGGLSHQTHEFSAGGGVEVAQSAPEGGVGRRQRRRSRGAPGRRGCRQRRGREPLSLLPIPQQLQAVRANNPLNDVQLFK